MDDILSALLAARDLVYPPLYYLVTDMIPVGKAIKITSDASDGFYPDVWYFHPADWGQARMELRKQHRLIDFRTWRPTAEDVARSAAARLTRMEL